jgi:S1-C subfamily serine protease
MMTVAWCVGTAAAQSITDLFEEVAPSVVEIAVSQTALPERGAAQRTSVAGIGSGFLISADGMIMTAAHVVQTADVVVVRYRTGDIVQAKVVASEPPADVALIRAESVPPEIPAVRLGDSNSAKVGDQIFIVGAPFGFSHTLTVGHVSGRRQPNELFGGLVPVELLQTDAAINQGNSGGPMFNMRGEVIGVVSHILSLSGGFEGLGFVITSNLASQLLLEQKSMWSGMSGLIVEGDLARLLNIPQEHAVLVENVAAGSPASTLGLRPGTARMTIEGESIVIGGDVILAVQGIQVGEPDAYSRIRSAITGLAEDEQVIVTVLRGGKVVELRKLAYLIR